MDCLPACNQSLLKQDWSILLRIQTDHKLKSECFLYQDLVPLPKNSAFIFRFIAVLQSEASFTSKSKKLEAATDFFIMRGEKTALLLLELGKSVYSASPFVNHWHAKIIFHIHAFLTRIWSTFRAV